MDVRRKCGVTNSFILSPRINEIVQVLIMRCQWVMSWWRSDFNNKEVKEVQ
jgi:hypothetical protein